MTTAQPLSTRAWLADRAHRPPSDHPVLLHAPSHVFQSPGGGECQLLETARALEDQGIPVRPFSPWTDSLRSARLLHLFGMSREGLELARVARALGLPIVLSPICWYEPRALRALARSHIQALSHLSQYALRRLCPRFPHWRLELLNLADRILPNSLAESLQLRRLFHIDPNRLRVVPNGVDPRFQHANPSLFRTLVGSDDFILYTGRIEPRKNVLRLIQSARACNYPLVIIGNPVPGHDAYARLCEQAGQNLLTRIPALAHDDPLLASAYASARVFALVSWFETPGLSSLEAALAGTPVVSTPFGCTREYFLNHVHYAHPADPQNITHALQSAWNHQPGHALKQRILNHFLWSHVAEKTAEVYDELAP